jgi:hypothetical protein
MDSLKTDEHIEVCTMNRVNREQPFRFQIRQGDDIYVVDIRQAGIFSPLRQITGVVNLLGDVNKKHLPKDVSELVHANSLIPAVIASQLTNHDVMFIQVGTFSHRSDRLDYDPQTFYAASKYAGERFINFFSKSKYLKSVVLHTYDIYGPNQPHERLIPYLARSVRNGLDVHLTKGDQEIRPVFVKDLVRIVRRLLENLSLIEEPFREYDVYGPETFKVKDLPLKIAHILDISVEGLRVFHDQPYREREIFEFNPCHPLPFSDQVFYTLEQGIKDSGL